MTGPFPTGQSLTRVPTLASGTHLAYPLASALLAHFPLHQHAHITNVPKSMDTKTFNGNQAANREKRVQPPADLDSAYPPALWDRAA